MEKDIGPNLHPTWGIKKDGLQMITPQLGKEYGKQPQHISRIIASEGDLRNRIFGLSHPMEFLPVSSNGIQINLDDMDSICCVLLNDELWRETK